MRAGGGWGRSPPQMPAPPEPAAARAGPFPEGPHLGPSAGPPDSSGRGGEAGLDLCPPHQSGKPRLRAGAEERPCPGHAEEGRPGGAGTQASGFSQPPLRM